MVATPTNVLFNSVATLMMCYRKQCCRHHPTSASTGTVTFRPKLLASAILTAQRYSGLQSGNEKRVGDIVVHAKNGWTWLRSRTGDRRLRSWRSGAQLQRCRQCGGKLSAAAVVDLCTRRIYICCGVETIICSQCTAAAKVYHIEGRI